MPETDEKVTETEEKAGGWIGGTLAALRKTPVWLLYGIGIAAFLIFYLPAPTSADAVSFRHKLGAAILAVGVLFMVLALARTVDLLVSHVLRGRPRKPLLIIPTTGGYWSSARQPDGVVATQFTVRANVTNLADGDVKIIQTRLLSPKKKGDQLHAFTLINSGQLYATDDVPANTPAIANVNFFLRRDVGKAGHHLRVSFELVDHIGSVYRFKRIDVPPLLIPHQTQPPPAPDARPLPVEWNNEGRFDRADLVLQEEQRQYGANGRQRGGLGSLNVTLQSEPNFGWTTEGVPAKLLWEKAAASPVRSENADRLLTFYDTLDGSSKLALDAYLRSHLDRRSPYANVAYFIFLVLYRRRDGIEALKLARQNLAGDSQFGYSNLIGTLAAIVSHEWFDMAETDLEGYRAALEGDTEFNFQLPRKIGLALLSDRS